MKRSEKGFTLIELLVVVAIVALIAAAANISIFQVLKGTERSNDHTTAIRQVQNAGYWISHDALMAQSVITGDDPETEDFLIFLWTEWQEDKKKHSIYHEVTYSFHDMADGLKKLKRQHLIYEEDEDVISETILVAEYIDSEESFFEPEEDGVWKLTIQARSGTETETREYEINPRVNI